MSFLVMISAVLEFFNLYHRYLIYRAARSQSKPVRRSLYGVLEHPDHVVGFDSIEHRFVRDDLRTLRNSTTNKEVPFCVIQKYCGIQPIARLIRPLPVDENGSPDDLITKNVCEVLDIDCQCAKRLLLAGDENFLTLWNFCINAFDSDYVLCRIVWHVNPEQRAQRRRFFDHPRITEHVQYIVEGYHILVALRLKRDFDVEPSCMLCRFLPPQYLKLQSYLTKFVHCCKSRGNKLINNVNYGLPTERTCVSMEKFVEEGKLMVNFEAEPDSLCINDLLHRLDDLLKEDVVPVAVVATLDGRDRQSDVDALVSHLLVDLNGHLEAVQDEVADNASFDEVLEFWTIECQHYESLDISPDSMQCVEGKHAVIASVHRLFCLYRKLSSDFSHYPIPPPSQSFINRLWNVLTILTAERPPTPPTPIPETITFQGYEFNNGENWNGAQFGSKIVVKVSRDRFPEISQFYRAQEELCWVLVPEDDVLRIYDEQETERDVRWLRYQLSKEITYSGKEFINRLNWEPKKQLTVVVSEDTFARVEKYYTDNYPICWVIDYNDGVLEIFDENGQVREEQWLHKYLQDTVLFDGKYFVNGRWWNDAEVGKKVVVIVSEDTFHSVKRLHVPENEICWVLAQEAGVFTIVDEENKERDRKWLWRRFSTLIIDGKQFIDRRFWSEEELGQKLVIIVGKDKLRQVLRLYDKKFDICWVFDVCDEGVLEIFDEHGIQQNLDWILEHLLTKTIMFIGQSGAGKSTLINGIPNYLKWPRFADTSAAEIEVVVPVKFDVQPPDDPFSNVTVRDGLADTNENFNDDGHSVTQHPRTYRHTLADGTPLRIIDTPGLSDTRGVTQDSRNLDLIREAIEAAGQVHAVCFVLDANKSRLTMELELALRDLLALFPQTVQSVVFFFFTYANSTFFAIGDTVKPLRQFLESVRVRHGTTLPLRPENHFCVDNETLRLLIAEKQNVVYSRRPTKDFEISWEKTTEAVGRFLGEVEKVQPLPTTEVTRVHELSTLVRRLQNYLAGSPRGNEDTLRTALAELEQEMRADTFVTLSEPQESRDDPQAIATAVRNYQKRWSSWC